MVMQNKCFNVFAIHCLIFQTITMITFSKYSQLTLYFLVATYITIQVKTKGKCSLGQLKGGNGHLIEVLLNRDLTVVEKVTVHSTLQKCKHQGAKCMLIHALTMD